ncbi:MAG: ribbon-helix-helix domain-containing protein, partial [Chromatiaceae bacterium]|nr:ribbon-helix-helix domain-containing protein [Chromatiaceae bacterium]
MTSLTVTLPDDTYRRLDEIAQGRGQSIDALFDAMASQMVAEA